jgi:hypothetical protein
MNTYRFIPLLALICASALFNGCASVVRGSSEKVSIHSTPSGAEVRLSTGQSGTTPFEAEVPRKGTVFVSIKKDGYKPLETALISSIDGASLGLGTAANFLFLPIVNDIVDYKTGANYSHKPNPLVVNLIPASSSETYPFTPPPIATAEEAPRSAKLEQARMPRAAAAVAATGLR